MRSLQFSNNRVKDLRGKISFLHEGKEQTSSAFELNEAASVRILLPRLLGVVSVYASFFNESFTDNLINFIANWVGVKNQFDVYEFNLDTQKLGVGLYFFQIRIESQHGILHATPYGTDILFIPDGESFGIFQASVSDFKYKRSEQKLGGIIYHIFVDRFMRGGSTTLKPDAITGDDWRTMPEYPTYPGAPLKNNHFYGGTLWGIADKLDYIKSLGVNTIYLSPVFDAASNHKYDTADYMTVDSMFGGEEALVHLIDKAKSLDIGIILDGVFNHTGSDSIYFNRYGNYNSVGAYNSKESKYYTWYDFQSYPDKYTCWWDIDILPRINPDKPECRKYFVGKGGVIEKYAKMGIDGFRLDVVDELSDSFVKDIKSVLNRYNKRSVLYGEVWEDGSNKVAYGRRKTYYLGDELDGVMNYPIRKGIVEYLTTSNTHALRYALTDVINNAPKRIRDMQMNLLGTHDTERILTVLGAESAVGRSNEYLSKKKMDDLKRGIAKRRLRMAYAILATVPGIPSIFYGDEVGLEGYHDPFNRMPYPWGREDFNLMAYYRRVGSIRREHAAYRDGDFKLLYLGNDALAFTRYEQSAVLLTFVNNTKQSVTIEFSKPARALISGSESDAQPVFEIPAYSAEIFEIEHKTEIYF